MRGGYSVFHPAALNWIHPIQLSEAFCNIGLVVETYMDHNMIGLKKISAMAQELQGNGECHFWSQPDSMEITSPGRAEFMALNWRKSPNA